MHILAFLYSVMGVEISKLLFVLVVTRHRTQHVYSFLFMWPTHILWKIILIFEKEVGPRTANFLKYGIVHFCYMNIRGKSKLWAFQIISCRSVYIKTVNYSRRILANLDNTMQTKQHATKKPNSYSNRNKI